MIAARVIVHGVDLESSQLPPAARCGNCSKARCARTSWPAPMRRHLPTSVSASAKDPLCTWAHTTKFVRGTLGSSLVDAIPLLQGERGRPRHRPDCVADDRYYDAESIRRGLRVRHIVPWLAKRNTDMAVDWADGAGWWNGPLLGSTSSADCVCAMGSGRISTRRS